MVDNSLIITKVTQAVITKKAEKPSPDSVVEALLIAEKTAKKNKQKYSFDQLRGTWRLCFITGTKKSRARAGIVLGAGRYLPDWVKIKITYQANTEPTVKQEQDFEAGRVENLVELGPLQLCVTGPVKFLSGKNILVFDFTRTIVQVFGVKLYSGYIRGGKVSEEKFYQTSVSKQAFFAYFLVTEASIAARGKGGGLAIWARV
ncbi:MAG: hypothetical protein AB4038_13415 [Prochloraceae cyanobacterium]